MDSPRHPGLPLWLWPNVLSLDAPAVAVLWQLLLSHTISPVPPAATLVLGLTVWLIYVADRLFDTLAPPSPHESARHRFARQHRRAFLLAALFAFLLDLAVALLYLPAVYYLAGSLLLLGVAARTWLSLRLPTRAWPKNLITALLFTAGVWTPLLLENPLRPGALLFVFLCWWNCRAIDIWESNGSSETNDIPRPTLLPPALLLVLAALAFYTWTHWPLALAEVASALSFCLLALQAPRLHPNVSRVAVDLCLCTPLFFYAGQPLP